MFSFGMVKNDYVLLNVAEIFLKISKRKNKLHRVLKCM